MKRSHEKKFRKRMSVFSLAPPFLSLYSLLIIGTSAFNLQVAEHTFNGTRYDMEIHMVHQNSMGNRAVVGIVYKIGPPDPFLSKLLPSIKSVTKEEKAIGRLNPKDILFQGRKYYRYMGSLTTPPCTEGIVWTVLEKVVTVSREQVQALKDVVDPGFRENARRIQKLHEGPVYVYGPPEIGNVE